MKKRTHARWTAGELELLHEMYCVQNAPWDEMLKALPRHNRTAIEMKLSQRQMKRPGRILMTIEQERWLRTNWAHVSIRFSALVLGVSPWFVMKWTRQLGLRKSASYGAEWHYRAGVAGVEAMREKMRQKGQNGPKNQENA